MIWDLDVSHSAAHSAFSNVVYNFRARKSMLRKMK
jgi:hypothetical protein